MSIPFRNQLQRRADASSSKAKEPVDAQKQELALNSSHNSSHDVVSNATEEASETKLKEATATAKSQSKEDQSSNSGEIVLGPKLLESIVEYTTNLANEKTSNATGEIFCCLSGSHVVI